MSTYFIADLHLCDQQPQISKSFVVFCRDHAIHAEALYILGDFFEYWLGDDAIDKTALMVKKELKVLANQGVKLYFMAGNRDFLLGSDFAQQCGMHMLIEPTVIDLYGEPVLLVHGDAQCIDDIPYQQVRQTLRNKKWQQEFLNKSIEDRIEFAKQAREQSQKHTQNSSTEIMDVNSTAIQELFSTHQVDTIIHGHTHRPAVHLNGTQKRIVLGDWHQQTSYLLVDEAGAHLVNE